MLLFVAKSTSTSFILSMDYNPPGSSVLRIPETRKQVGCLNSLSESSQQRLRPASTAFIKQVFYYWNYNGTELTSTHGRVSHRMWALLTLAI